MPLSDYDIIIGLEVHAELKTESKIFCGCSTEFGGLPNSHVCPVCLGLPGALPVLNEQALDYAIMAGLALNCTIAPYSKFDRKQYFYPDSPKAYQISQYDLPFCTNGWIEIPSSEEKGKTKKARIIRVHLEEEAGKTVHSGSGILNSQFALEDYNRCGIPLIEIVGAPDLRSPEEARYYLERLKAILQYTGVSDCKMEEGSLRCDANISLRRKGTTEFGVLAEIKNMNSFKAVRKALSYEEKRQISILNRGGKIQQETRLWNDKLQKTEIMRTKEEAHDYRYFPEPDLLPVEIDDEFINKVKEEIGQLPDDRKERIKLKYGLPIYDIDVLMSEKIIIDYFEECSKIFKNYKLISNWIMGEIMSLLKGKEIKFLFEKIPPVKFIDLLKMVEEGKITSTVGKNVLKEILKTGKFPSEIVKEKGLLQIGDEEFIENIVKQVIDENQKAVDDYKKGKEKVMGFLIGQVMKKTKGKVNSEVVEKTIKKLI